MPPHSTKNLHLPRHTHSTNSKTVTRYISHKMCLKSLYRLKYKHWPKNCQKKIMQCKTSKFKIATKKTKQNTVRIQTLPPQQHFFIFCPISQVILSVNQRYTLNEEALVCSGQIYRWKKWPITVLHKNSNKQQVRKAKNYGFQREGKKSRIKIQVLLIAEWAR